MNAYRLSVAVLVLAAVARADDPKPESWKGQLVVGKKYPKQIQFGDVIDGKQVYFEFLGIYPQKVRDERDGWLRLYDGHREGWVDKDDFVLSRDATAYFTDRIRANPDDYFAWWSRGTAWSDRGEHDNAIKDFTECIRLNPNEVWAYNSRGIAHRDKKQGDKAIADYTEAIRLDPKFALAFNNRGNVHKAMKDYDKAIADYTEAIRLDPKFALAFNERGIAQYANGAHDDAIKDFTEAIRLDRKFTLAFNNRGIVYRDKKDYNAAIKDFTEAIRLYPNYSNAFYNRAVTHLILRQPESIKGFQTVLDLEDAKPGRSRKAVIFGHFAARRHDDAAAAKRFLGESAAKLGEDWPFPAVRFLRGDIDEAALLKAATDDDKRTEARCFLGLDHLLKGRTDEATAHFRWVKEHGTTTFIEYAVAVAELERLEKAKK